MGPTIERSVQDETRMTRLKRVCPRGYVIKQGNKDRGFIASMEAKVIHLLLWLMRCAVHAGREKVVLYACIRYYFVMPIYTKRQPHTCWSAWSEHHLEQEDRKNNTAFVPDPPRFNSRSRGLFLELG